MKSSIVYSFARKVLNIDIRTATRLERLDKETRKTRKIYNFLNKISFQIFVYACIPLVFGFSSPILIDLKISFFSILIVHACSWNNKWSARNLGFWTFEFLYAAARNGSRISSIHPYRFRHENARFSNFQPLKTVRRWVYI